MRSNAIRIRSEINEPNLSLLVRRLFFKKGSYILRRRMGSLILISREIASATFSRKLFVNVEMS